MGWVPGFSNILLAPRTVPALVLMDELQRHAAAAALRRGRRKFVPDAEQQGVQLIPRGWVISPAGMTPVLAIGRYPIDRPVADRAIRHFYLLPSPEGIWNARAWGGIGTDVFIGFLRHPNLSGIQSLRPFYLASELLLEIFIGIQSLVGHLDLSGIQTLMGFYSVSEA